MNELLIFCWNADDRSSMKWIFWNLKIRLSTHLGWVTRTNSTIWIFLILPFSCLAPHSYLLPLSAPSAICFLPHPFTNQFLVAFSFFLSNRLSPPHPTLYHLFSFILLLSLLHLFFFSSLFFLFFHLSLLYLFTLFFLFFILLWCI